MFKGTQGFGAAFKIGCVPFQGVYQTEIVKNAGAQAGRCLHYVSL